MNENQLELKDSFTWYEKLLMRGGLAALVGIGAFAIYSGGSLLAACYLLFVAVGGIVVMYDAVCVYCPYPYKHSDCLFFPYQLVASVTTLRTTAISWHRKALAALTFAGIVAIPQYWLWGQWGLFAVFWTLVIAGAITVPLHLCRRCRHRRCPMNLVSLQTK